MRRLPVAVGIDHAALREQVVARLAGGGLEVVTVEPEDLLAGGSRVVVTARRPLPGRPTGVVVYLAAPPETWAARLVSGQWLHLEGLDEVVAFLREITLDEALRLDG